MPSRRPPGPSGDAILAVVERAGGRPVPLREIAERLGLDRYDRRQLEAALVELAASGRVRRIGPSRWQWTRRDDRGERSRGRDGGAAAEGRDRHRPHARDAARPLPRGRAPHEHDRRERPRRDDRTPRGRTPRDRVPRDRAPRDARGTAPGREVVGRYSRARAGFGFIEVEGPERARFPRDVFVPEGMEDGALHGDRVRVEIIRHDPHVHRATGRIVDVVAPAAERIVGALEDAQRPTLLRPPAGRAPRAARGARGPRGAPGPVERRWWLVPLNDLLPIVEIAGGIEPSSFDAGKLALVRLTRRPDGVRGAAGELERVLGDPEDPEVQFLTIALEHGLRIEFPPEAESEARGLPVDPLLADLEGREDLRGLPFVTIDGETARDFDDAVCLETLDGGLRRLRVAIADVSHYVRPGTAVDAEARERGTSVYFPDRAVPMLPEALSNGLCSLVPDRDRLVMVAEMDLDRRGVRRAQRFYRAVLRSRARLTYTQVAAVLSSTDAASVRAQREELADLLPQLQQMRDLMRLLLRRRLAAGSLDLDLPEALVDLSEEGRSIGVRFSPRNEAHRIIEELMLQANIAVASYLEERGLPLPYRVHEPPDAEDVEELNRLLGAFGFAVEYDAEHGVRPADVQRSLAAMAGHPLSRVLSRHVLRALKQARYSTENAGHFGLAFPVYCHFTSPIRRYPDLLVHRQLGALLDGAAEDARGRGAELEHLSLLGSQRERQAVDAERAMLDLKRAEFMLDHLLEPEPATIVGVVKFGLFVEVEAYPVEGLVRAEDLSERFELDERAHALVGVRTRARLRLGDRVLVEATDVSLRRRQVTFALLEHLPAESAGSGGGKQAKDRGKVKAKAKGGRRKRAPG